MFGKKFGVKEKNIKDNPQALNTFVDLLKYGITEVQKIIVG